MRVDLVRLGVLEIPQMLQKCKRSVTWKLSRFMNLPHQIECDQMDHGQPQREVELLIPSSIQLGNITQQGQYMKIFRELKKPDGYVRCREKGEGV